MAKKKVVLTEDQLARNAAILRRIQEEKERLLADTRAIQDEWNHKKRRRRRKSSLATN